MREDQVRRMVRRVVHRTLGLPQGSAAPAQSRIVTEADLQGLAPGSRFAPPEGALLTPLARQIALERRIDIGDGPATAADERRLIAIGADHGGYELKELLKRSLAEWDYSVQDCGTDSTDSVDYPDFAYAVARMVADGRAWRGVVIDGAGIGSCMAANKVPGVRAAMCYDRATAVNSREHNDANLLTLGAAMIGSGTARAIVKTWLETEGAAGRHARRVQKINEIERRYMKAGVAA